MSRASGLTAAELHERVPPDWYHDSIRRNPFQRFWHRTRFRVIGGMTRPAETFLDIGCADGAFSEVLAKRSGARTFTGVDVLETSVRWSAEHYKNDSRFSFRVADAHQLPFPDNTFDAVACMEALEHVFDPLAVLREARRVLKPGGYGLFLVPTDSLLFRIIWFVWTRLRGAIWEGTHIQSFTGHLLRETVEKAGFTVEEERFFLWGMLVAVRARKAA